MYRHHLWQSAPPLFDFTDQRFRAVGGDVDDGSAAGGPNQSSPAGQAERPGGFEFAGIAG